MRKFKKLVLFFQVFILIIGVGMMGIVLVRAIVNSGVWELLLLSLLVPVVISNFRK